MSSPLLKARISAARKESSEVDDQEVESEGVTALKRRRSKEESMIELVVRSCCLRLKEGGLFISHSRACRLTIPSTHGTRLSASCMKVRSYLRRHAIFHSLGRRSSIRALPTHLPHERAYLPMLPTLTTVPATAVCSGVPRMDLARAFVIVPIAAKHKMGQMLQKCIDVMSLTTLPLPSPLAPRHGVPLAASHRSEAAAISSAAMQSQPLDVFQWLALADRIPCAPLMAACMQKLRRDVHLIQPMPDNLRCMHFYVPCILFLA